MTSALRHAYASCPLCDSPDFAKIRESDCTRHPSYDPGLPPTITWCLCETCGHCFTDGWFTAEAQQLLFKRTLAAQHVQRTVNDLKQLEQRRNLFAPIVARVTAARGGVPTGGETWLDIGIGDGSMLFTASEWGYRPIGIDIRRENVAMLGELGIEGHAGDFRDYDAPASSLDVISMADVLEHMPLPHQGVARAVTLLKPGGVIFVSMPNHESVLWKALDGGNINPYWGELEHYHNFSRARLYTLLRHHGLEIVDYYVSSRYRVCMEVIARKPA